MLHSSWCPSWANCTRPLPEVPCKPHQSTVPLNKFRTKCCKFDMAGKCKKGQKCPFAHPTKHPALITPFGSEPRADPEELMKIPNHPGQDEVQSLSLWTCSTTTASRDE
eukprot:Sspe_Gene.31356::Locus_15478_Transcript_1_1_Confidence_1.000_Length_477::g.31356::m.31356